MKVYVVTLTSYLDYRFFVSDSDRKDGVEYQNVDEFKGVFSVEKLHDAELYVMHDIAMRLTNKTDFEDISIEGDVDSDVGRLINVRITSSKYIEHFEYIIEKHDI